MLRLETVAPRTLALTRRLLALPALSRTRLVGGTALALQLGHRISVDLDLFGPWDERLDLGAELSACGAVEDMGGSGKMRFFVVDGVKVDCVAYPHPWLDPAVCDEGLRLASIRDIAAMKLSAVTGRGSRKDFVDIAFLLKTFSLREMLALFREKDPGANEYISLRSLTYFTDAETQPLPALLVPFDWDKAKADIRAAVEELA